MREVKAKRKHWRDKRIKRDERTKKVEEFLGKHMIPVILGPKGRYYVIDHHHLARALHEEGVKDVAVTVIANLSKLDRDAFWFVMDNRVMYGIAVAVSLSLIDQVRHAYRPRTRVLVKDSEALVSRASGARPIRSAGRNCLPF